MRRIKLVLAALAVMAATLASVSSPALADDHLNCRDARGFLIRCDHQLFAPVNDVDDDDFFFSPLFGFPFVSTFDVDFENVGPRNDFEGECIPTDLDFDGFIAEWEVTCFV
jgi:hypothetical protein